MTTSTKFPLQTDEYINVAQSYQKTMLGLNAVVMEKPSNAGVVIVKPGQLTSVAVQVGQHYKLRKIGNDGVTQQTPDNVMAVRHGDALHVRYADGSIASFENFYSTCTSGAECSVNLANDSSEGITLSAADVGGPVADDGLLVYAHGERDVLMGMAQDQSALLSTIRGLGDEPVLTYLPPSGEPGALALLALALLGAAGSAATSGAAALSSGAVIAAASPEALAKISTAAENNTAVSSHLGVADYAAAQVTGVTEANLASINSALDSAAVTGAKADSTSKIQGIVDAYKAILDSANGVPNDAGQFAPTASQYTRIGVTGVFGTPARDLGIFLLNNAVDAKPNAGVDTEEEVQAIANAAYHVMDAAGGTATQIAALTQADLIALGVTGVTSENFAAVQAAIGATTSDSAVKTVPLIQELVTAVINGGGVASALNQISDAAQHNTATDATPAAGVYAAAGVTGVNAGILASINSALNSATVTGAQADTTAEVQGIVNAYSAILGSADGVADNTTTPLTGTQYSLVGVTGVSGLSAPGNALHLLDSVVDAALVPAVDTVPELQAMADAASHVIGGSSGGAAPTLLDLVALGISGVTGGNLAAVQAAIAATPDNGTGVDSKAELQAVVTVAIGSTQVPHITSALGGINNLDVTSNLVLNADQSLTAGSGFIHITDLGGPGYQGDSSNNTQTIDVSTAIANHLLTITGSGANTHIVINPLWDLDLASNYQLSIDDGAFLNATGTQAATHFAPINFGTVTPGVHSGSGTAASEGHASQVMLDATGAMAIGKSWLDIEGIGANTGPVTQLGDLSTGSYALVMKNYATTRGGDPALGGNGTDGIAAHDTNVGVVNFGNNDIVYFDSQANNASMQFFDARYTIMADGGVHGGQLGQNMLVIGTVAVPQQAGSSANILLGLEGNTTGQLYSSVVSIPGSMGWADAWHTSGPAVIMG